MNWYQESSRLLLHAIVFAVLASLVLVLSWASFTSAGDPAGGATGGINDVSSVTPGAPTFIEIADQVGHNSKSSNIPGIDF